MLRLIERRYTISHYYGTVAGQAKSEGTRRGSKNSGIIATAKTWEQSISVNLTYDKEKDMDIARVTHRIFNQDSRCIYLGDLAKFGPMPLCGNYYLLQHKETEVALCVHTIKDIHRKKYNIIGMINQRGEIEPI